MQPDVDRLLRRGLALQRYVSSLVSVDGSAGELVDALRPGDRRIVAALGEFVAEGDERAFAALARGRTNLPEIRALFAEFRVALTEQRQAIRAVLDEQLPTLIEAEARITAEAIESEPPSTRGVMTEAVGGLTVAAITAGVGAGFERRMLSEVTMTAGTAPERIVQVVRGSRAERYRDGVIGWRNRRSLRPAAGQIVNGVAANAAVHTYRAARIDELDWLATLDYRTCPRCIAREADGPYPIDRAPRPQEHPECRCRLLPAQSDGEIRRPYVRDTRSVKDIPLSERTSGKIGTTRQPIETFFERMTKAQRRAYLGPSRAALWEAGKVTDMRRFVNDITNEPLRLDQLPEL